MSFYHKPALPKETLACLISCSHIVVSRNRTIRICMKPKIPNKQHFILHLDPFEQSDDDNNNNDNVDNDDDNNDESRSPASTSTSSYDELKDDKSNSS